VLEPIKTELIHTYYQQIMEKVMGETEKSMIFGFRWAIKFKFSGCTINSNANLFLYRELHERLKLTKVAAANLLEIRTCLNKQNLEEKTGS
jgi:hypothetical protein